jgi:hypothetical protein
VKKLHKLLIWILAATLLLVGGCAKKYEIPNLEANRDAFFNVWDSVLPTEKIEKDVLKNRATEYPEALNLETNPSVLSAEDFTGPVFWLRVPGETYINRQQYIPDMTREEFLTNDALPDELELDTRDLEYLLRGYGGEFASEEKLAALQDGDLPIVYALIESTGYLDGGKTYYYPSGNSVTLYTPTWRVSYYSYPDGELLAWETADRPYQSGESMSLDNTALDVNGKCVLTRRQDGLFLEVMDESLKLLVID